MISPEKNLLLQYYKYRLPMSAGIDLTYRCPLRCVHCLRKGQDTNELSTRTWLRIIDELHDLRTLYLGFSGGELLLRKDLTEILSYARTKSFAVSVKTSGFGATTEIIEELADMGIQSFDVSFYSSTPDIHERVTGVPGSFQQTLSFALQLQSQGCKVRTAFTALVGYETRIDHTIKELEKLGLQEVLLNHLKPYLCDHDCTHLWDETRYLSRIKGGKPLRPLEFIEPEQGNRHLCDSSLLSLHIRPDGTVTPCYKFTNGVGNVTKQSLREIWFESHELTQFRTLTWDSLESCRNCPDKEYCNFCPAAALHINGAMDRPVDWFCTHARARREKE